ncbi:hypothetical protein K461DRAFT_306871 [Myriangium duriaei CBS 260.36]|uniref:Tat pathway signal sequence n=1 Tax=Myriangium duriaei CBS 260.36 TaxID=1168546 RepID=A0A9P4MFX4_9PEZI|nr:hypothetical protein K461DRAFT_306871 [Myriangium duriaei CBS 260.36]
MGAKTYTALTKEPCYDGDEVVPVTLRKRYIFVVIVAFIATILAAASAALNFYLILGQHSIILRSLDTGQYALLPRNVITEIFQITDHENTNRTLQDAAWTSPELAWGSLLVAFDQQHIKDMNLPPSEPWPWDTSRSQYLLKGAHDLHCLHTIRQAYNAYHDGAPKHEHTIPYSHTIHCLNVLRQTIMCIADDTPLYVGRWNANAITNSTTPGSGSTTMCRDWNALNAWASRYSGCYEPVYNGDSKLPFPERYKFCPNGAMPWSKAPQV